MDVVGSPGSRIFLDGNTILPLMPHTHLVSAQKSFGSNVRRCRKGSKRHPNGSGKITCHLMAEFEMTIPDWTFSA